MLDDANVLQQRDPRGALTVAAEQWQQVQFQAQVQEADHDGRTLTRVVMAGMGGSGLSSLLIKDWLGTRLTVPFEVVRGYDLPGYVDDRTLVIASSYSGNTEEALSCLDQALARGAQVGIVGSGGRIIDFAKQRSIGHVVVPGGVSQRMAMFYMLRASVSLLVNFGIIGSDIPVQIAQTADWLRQETAKWLPDVTTDKNEAKQLALLAVGKTPVIYGGQLTGALAYKWKISWNENAKNVAFWNSYPEFNHNEFIGWSSHPVEKPFAVFDLISNFEHPQILKRFEISDRLLSGQRPKSHVVNLQGETLIQQLLRGCILADFVTIYVAILNGVDPVPVELIEKLKRELA